MLLSKFQKNFEGNLLQRVKNHCFKAYLLSHSKPNTIFLWPWIFPQLCRQTLTFCGRVKNRKRWLNEYIWASSNCFFKSVWHFGLVVRILRDSHPRFLRGLVVMAFTAAGLTFGSTHLIQSFFFFNFSI